MVNCYHGEEYTGGKTICQVGNLKIIKKLVTVQPLHLLVFIFMKTRSLVVPPYADLDEKVLMQASLQHTFSFKPAHG